ncbi:kinase-like domain-containing protein [Syncephalastrum racemosum]|uniref:Kinase-like domain-containing protein n=1 Tax=Syncephalastrum racemosum TaxID=13706 RepID=A0A1X2HHC9_SYNRA|nr:kinase-like domain-containing protein [Syncephalastrum racemosum]
MSQVKSRKGEIIVGPYERIDVLGRGNFGKVYLARNRKTGLQVAMKVVDKTSLKSGDQRQHALNEQAICEGFSIRMRHKNIVNVYEVLTDHDNIYIAMEFIEGGELFDRIKRAHHLDEARARKWFREIVEAVFYIHENGIVHRDLKPENVLIDINGHARLCDFGFGKICEQHQVLNTYCGSPFYAAPEMVTATPYKGPPVDMWSCGVILFAMLSGTLPFQGEDMPQLFRRINTGSYRMPSHVSRDAADLIDKLLCRNAKQRYSAADCLRHPWLNHSTLPARRPVSAVLLRQAHRRPTEQHTKHHSHKEVPDRPLSSSSTTVPATRTSKVEVHTTAVAKRSRVPVLFNRFFPKKAQVAPSAAARQREKKTLAAASSADSIPTKNKVKSVEGRMVSRMKDFLKSAFQRRIT